jgi:hypothetical protein
MAKKDDIVTPIGTLKYPFLNQPRDFDGDGKFKFDTKLILSGQRAEELRKIVDDLCESLVGKPHSKLKNSVYEEGSSDDGATFTEFRFKVNAVGKSPATGKEYSRRPRFMKADGTWYDSDEIPAVGGGTRARIAFEPYAWPKEKPTGLQLQPKVVKVIELVERAFKDESYYEGIIGGAEDEGTEAPRATGKAEDY